MSGAIQNRENKNEIDREALFLGRFHLVLSTSFLGALYGIILGTLILYQHGLEINVLLNYCMTVFLIGNGIVLWRKKTLRGSTVFLVVIMSTFFLFLLWMGGAQNVGYLWSFVLPAGYYFLLERRGGTLAHLIYFTVAIVLMCFPFNDVMREIYSLAFILRFGAVYILVAVISYMYEYYREVNESMLVKEIREHEKSEAALRVAMQSAEAANIAKGEFLANMSHEIRTPMNGVLGLGALLLETPLSLEQKGYVDNILNSAESLMTLINDILDYSKIESGRIDLESIEFDIRTTVESAVEVLALRAQEKGVELAALVNAQVPWRVKGDPGRLRQVLVNLIGNAVKFTDAGEVVVRVDVDDSFGCVDGAPVRLRFSVKDTGIGIPPAAMGRLFRVFSQVDASTTRRFGGTGLGLAISKQLVELMDGAVTVESTPDVGSTFTFTSVFVKVPDSCSRQFSGTDPAGSRILIAAPAGVGRSVLEQYLVDLGCRVKTADDARATIEFFETTQKSGTLPDVALLDQSMPLVNGVSLARVISSQDGTIPTRFVLITGSGMRGDVTKLKESGIVAYLSKPFRQSVLAECLRLVLAAPATGDPAGSELVTKHTIAEAQREKRIRVLFAEDNPVNQMVAGKMIEKAGYACDIAVNGMDAVKAFERRAYDIIFMDIQMPVLSGYDAARAIRDTESAAADGRHIPIVALTANAMKGDKEKCIVAGMDDYLSKPFSRESLLAMIAQWTDTENRGA